MLQTLIDVVHIFVCLALMFIVLLQQGKGGGMGAAFGGGGAAQVFGGRGAGNILTRATSIFAAVFMITSVSLAYLSSSRDRSLEKAVQVHKQKMSQEGAPRTDAPKSDEKDKKPEDKKDNAPAPSPSDAPKP